MAEKVKRLGIMGGTFDPIHYGHLVTAEAARGVYALDQVLFIPSGVPPHKDAASITDAEHRYTMTVLATLTNPHFEASRVDIDRTGTTYTIDTLKSLNEEFGETVSLYFITGADAIMEIVSWKEPQALLDLAEFIAATRPGFALEDHAAWIDEWFAHHGKSLNVLQVPAMAISSTDIRRRVTEGSSVRYLVPETVEFYIRKNRLYRSNHRNS